MTFTPKNVEPRKGVPFKMKVKEKRNEQAEIVSLKRQLADAKEEAEICAMRSPSVRLSSSPTAGAKKAITIP